MRGYARTIDIDEENITTLSTRISQLKETVSRDFRPLVLCGYTPGPLIQGVKAVSNMVSYSLRFSNKKFDSVLCLIQ
jgi:hypothetical protein